MARAMSHLPFYQGMQRTWAGPESPAGSCPAGSHWPGLMPDQQVPETPFSLSHSALHQSWHPSPWAGRGQRLPQLQQQPHSWFSSCFQPGRAGIPLLLTPSNSESKHSPKMEKWVHFKISKLLSLYFSKFFQNFISWKCLGFNKAVLSKALWTQLPWKLQI